MIKSIRLRNFKSFEDSNEVEIKPITILCGTNSSGKSSILKSLISLKQSWESDRSLNSLALNGKYTRNGKFNDVVHLKQKSQLTLENKFSVKFGGSTEKRQSDHFSYSLLNKIYVRAEANEIKKNIDRRESAFTIQYKAVFDSTDKYENMTIKGSNDSIITSIEISINFQNSNKCFRSSLIRMNYKGEENRFAYSLEYENMPTASGYTSRKFKQVNCFFSGLQLTNITPGYENDDFYPVLSSIITIFQVIGEQYDSVSYIGPLREEPKRMYVFDEAVIDVGVKGELAPMVYSSNTAKIYDMPKYEGDNSIIFTEDTLTFQEAVNYWLSYLEINSLGIGQTDEILRLLLENGLEGGVNISDVGFGISQALPIVVESLRIPKGSTLVLEQPEIHLHPKMQMKLADFFIAMSRFDRHFIIETHSDHIVNRLVRRIMEDSSNLLNNQIVIYFITQYENKSKVEKIEIDLIKGIIEWPKEFFDQYANEVDLIMKTGFRNNRLLREKKTEDK